MPQGKLFDGSKAELGNAIFASFEPLTDVKNFLPPIPMSRPGVKAILQNKKCDPRIWTCFQQVQNIIGKARLSEDIIAEADDTPLFHESAYIHAPRCHINVHRLLMV